jgi:hypothetical protein
MNTGAVEHDPVAGGIHKVLFNHGFSLSFFVQTSPLCNRQWLTLCGKQFLATYHDADAVFAIGSIISSALLVQSQLCISMLPYDFKQCISIFVARGVPYSFPNNSRTT